MKNPLRGRLMIQLFPNLLTKKKSYKAKVSLAGTYTNESIARAIVERRSEYRYESILHVLNMCDEIKREKLSHGFAVNDGVYHATPTVTGRFNNTSERFNPEKHQAGLVVVPSLAMRKELADCSVKTLGKASVGPDIGMVEDIYSKTMNRYLTSQRNIRVHGSRLQLAGDNPTVGVYLVAAENETVRIRIDEQSVVANNPKQLLLMLPELTPGNYYVEVVTQYTKGSILVKAPRSARTDMALEASFAE